MKFMMFISFLLSICYGGIWISVGLLMRNHLETVLSMILRKPIPDNLINPADYQKTISVLNVIGILLILIGIGTMIIGLYSMIAGLSMPSTNFNFKF